jgi:hypothetical protein
MSDAQKIADALDAAHDKLMPGVRETREFLGALIAHREVRERNIGNLYVHDHAIELRYLLDQVDKVFGKLASEADNLRPSPPA